MEWMEKSDPIVALPREFVMVSRVSLMLRGLGHALKQPRSIATAWRPLAERVLRENGEEAYIIRERKATPHATVNEKTV